jgi:O-methyltransferase
MVQRGHVPLSEILLRLYRFLMTPVAAWILLDSRAIHPAYRMTRIRSLRLAFQMIWNSCRIPTGTSYRAHLAMALKLLEMSPEQTGVVVECGTWKGGSAVNLSLICRIVDRKLIICDSFQGLPEGEEADREARHYRQGDYAGSLEEVKRNISRYGSIEQCEFVPGFFRESLPGLSSPIVLAFLDVDLEASLAICVRNIWPLLVDGGFIFTDECAVTDYVALFFSERWWRENFETTPPGLIGAGTGLPLGEFYIGPYSERASHPLQRASTAGYTFKGMSGHWTYFE